MQIMFDLPWPLKVTEVKQDKLYAQTKGNKIYFWSELEQIMPIQARAREVSYTLEWVYTG